MNVDIKSLDPEVEASESVKRFERYSRFKITQFLPQISIRPQTLDLLVLGPAMGLFCRSRGDGKIKKTSNIVLLYNDGGDF